MGKMSLHLPFLSHTHMFFFFEFCSTLISHSGTVLHIGQFFFNETWNDKVFAVAPYTNNKNSRTLNEADSILQQENADGNNAYIQ